ncbi:diaminopimelate epimerase [Methylocystis parvus]|uniref:Diaminopimelate epimerase n=1 Tax=Methylocystis parvus TaxID=134 RepID=A0A6B8M8N2_9HYPH|nr:diaminopimelate epimerase [Methylocystis parvus]QGM98242.1 diaminopimelate epimerase [Methylocystis parvus]WBK01432.1 diaminopimelate epimerase [Methylocystis parvus OBBP]
MPHPLDNHPILRMNGAGNEILVLDLRGTDHVLAPEEARAIAAAPGLRFDQLMALHDPREAGDDAFMRIYNIDGSLSGACGNGARCVAYALAREGRERLSLATDAGRIETRREAETVFTVDMGRPRLDWRDIPLAREADTRAVALEPAAPGAPAQFSAVSMGNPHAVFFVDDAQAVPLASLGRAIECHPLFPERANVSFAQILSRDDILLRVWERGTGATKACGSAACATLVSAARAGLTERRARLRLPGGDLFIEWRADDHVLMTGPVEFEFETRLTAKLFEGAAA